MPGYTFKHALTHEVASGTILRERRRALHARIVTAIEAQSTDGPAEQLEQLAYHALQAELWEPARSTLDRLAREPTRARPCERQQPGSNTR